MNNNELPQNSIQIGIGVAIMSLYMPTHVNPNSIYIYENLFPKQTMDKNYYSDENYHSIKLLKNETNREEMIHDYYDEDDVVKIPIAKTVKVRFGKPKKKEFLI